MSKSDQVYIASTTDEGMRSDPYQKIRNLAAQILSYYLQSSSDHLHFLFTDGVTGDRRYCVWSNQCRNPIRFASHQRPTKVCTTIIEVHVFRFCVLFAMQRGNCALFLEHEYEYLYVNSKIIYVVQQESYNKQQVLFPR